MPPFISRSRLLPLLACIAVTATGCAQLSSLAVTRHAQVLHIDARDPGKSVRCEIVPGRAASTADERDGERGCTAWTGAALPPGTLTIDVHHRDPGVTYDVKVAQVTREADPADVKAILDGVARRMIDGVKATIARDPALGSNATLAAALDSAADAAPTATEALRAALDDEPATPAPDRAVVFGRYLVAAAAAGGAPTLLGVDAARAKWGADRMYGGPAIPAPPRVYRLGADDLAFLRQRGLADAAIKAWVMAWCDPASFPPTERADAYRALHEAPTPEALTAALAITPAELIAIWTGRSATGPLDRRIDQLIAEGDGPWADAGPAARTFLLMRLGAGLTLQLGTCAANLALVGAPTPPELTSLAGDARHHADAFTATLGAVFRSGLRTLERTAAARGDGSFGTFDLGPGRIEIEAGATRDQQRAVVGSFKAEVLGMERFAIVVGPMVTLCGTGWGCFDRFADYTDGRGRFIVRERRETDVAIATALHVTAFSTKRTAIGLVVGYPLGTPDATRYNLIGGVGLRLRSGFELTVGAHVFQTPTVRAGYGPTPIPLSANGHDDLTVDAVTLERWRAGVFVMVGLDPTLFSKLK